MSARHVQRLEQALGQKKKSSTAQDSDLDEAELIEEDEVPKKNAFSKLMVDLDDSSSSDVDEVDTKQDSKTETKDREETKTEESVKKSEGKKNSNTTSSKNKKKKKKGKQEKQRKEDEEVDKVLEELAKQALELNTSNKADRSINEKENRFQFSPQSLDADKEVKKRLGRALGGGASSARAGNQQAGAQQQLRQRGRGQMRMILPPGMGTTAAISSIPRVLVTPDAEWFNPPTFASGEGARMVRVEGTPNVVTFEASSSYIAAQAHFRELVKTFDPNEIIQMIQTHPFHVDSLLQLVEVFAASSQNETAQMMLRRALFTLESWCSPQFRSSLGSGQFVIQLPEVSSRFGVFDSSDEEEWLLSYDGNKDCGLNGAFLRAISLSMRVAGRRDCYETAFNLAKMLLSLSYERDPCFALLSVDYYAIKAKEYGWVISSHTLAEIASLPCVAFGLALALFHQSRLPNSTLERAKADEALVSAISRFPQYAENVLTKAERSVPANLNKIFQQHGAIPDVVDRVCALSYARQQSLWGEDVIGWMAGLLSNPSINFPLVDKSEPQLPNVQRYARCKLADLSDKVDLLPREDLVADEAQRMELAARNNVQGDEQEEGASVGRRLLNLNTNDLLLFALSAFPMFDLPPRREEGGQEQDQEDDYDEQDWAEDAD